MMNREFTGRNMATILVVGFGIVMAVNFLMASLAVSGFGGVIVENTYVASQKFNGWLDEAEADRALGWQASATRVADGYIRVETDSVPVGAMLDAQLRRPLGERETLQITFLAQADGSYLSAEPVSAGRWTMRLTITHGKEVWASEGPLS